MSKAKITSPDLKFSPGFLVTMSRQELDAIKAAVPAGMSLTTWARRILLAAIKPKQPTLFGDEA